MTDWFGDDELDLCPRCGESKVLREPAGRFYVCLQCGVLPQRENTC